MSEVNAMQVAQTVNKPTTIGELMEYLQKMKESWSETDTQYLGKFEDQPLYVAQAGKGVSQAFMQYHAEFGLIAFKK
ncbi:hypothetical protein [Marinobacter shengliensis]|uniref:hypothetical protein n=1 Tax=Marinobacter shengliensis TaxID=1389223 RepID=UPI001E539393|nr:hypothetical protein [Marinobacter shengliensis]MCD1628481.1 hypothetical protein [Marinobacter shengliensis]